MRPRVPGAGTGRDEAALAASLMRIERDLLAQRIAARPPAPEGTRWRSAYAALLAPMAVRHAANPASGAEICPGLRLFHDAGGGGTFSWAQRLPRAGLPELDITVYDFPGRFLSLVAEAPREVAEASIPGLVVEVAIEARLARPLTCFLRLNLERHGARETLYETRVLADGGLGERFDLAGVPPGSSGWQAMWLDIILHAPRMCRVEFRRIELLLRNSGRNAGRNAGAGP